MKYTGTYTNRKQVQRRAAISHITGTAEKIESAQTLILIQELCGQLHRIDSGNASRAEQLRQDILLLVIYHRDIKELELMKGLVIEVATLKARQARRVAKTTV